MNNRILEKDDLIQEQNMNIARQYHVDLGHPRPATVYRAMKERFFWKSMRSDIQKITDTCEQCLLFNDTIKKSSNYPILVGDAMERIAIDVVGPFVTTKSGNKFIVVAIDYLTKYLFAKAIPSKSANEIANFIFKHIILEHGCPAILLSDNGKEFKNDLIEHLCRELSINKKYSSPYRPQTNGLIERTNRTILAILAKNAYMEKLNWDKFIDIIRFNYNIRYQDNINCSPYELLYGRKPQLPYNLELSTKKENIYERMKRIQDKQENVMNKRRTLQEKNLKEIPHKEKITIGDIVLYKDQHRLDKLSPKFIGPYIVESASNCGSYVITDPNRKITKVAHKKQLKKICAKEISDDYKCKHEKLLEDEAITAEGKIVTDLQNNPVLNSEDENVKRRKICSLCFASFY